MAANGENVHGGGGLQGEREKLERLNLLARRISSATHQYPTPPGASPQMAGPQPLRVLSMSPISVATSPARTPVWTDNVEVRTSEGVDFQKSRNVFVCRLASLASYFIFERLRECRGPLACVFMLRTGASDLFH